MVRLAQAPPEIEVHFLKTTYPPTGLGEPSLPPIVPARGERHFQRVGQESALAARPNSGFSWA
jgi:isoquinoline 1-oxidoreductase beta subunit